MPGRSFDPALLATFLAVFDCARISSAAKVLGLSQPAVTAQVRKLEESLHAPLFVRSAQGVAPTAAGVRLAGYARTMQALMQEAVASVANAEEPSGPLAVAASTTVAAHVLPSLLAQFRAVHRDVPISVHVGNTGWVVQEVRAGRVPLGLVEGHARASGVRLEPFIDDEIVPIIGRDAPFLVGKATDLDRVPLLWREDGSGTRAVVERALRDAGLHRRTARDLDVELGSTEAILGGAVAGLGVAFVSRRSARAHMAAGWVRTIAGINLVIPRSFRWAVPPGALGGTAALFHAFALRSAVL